MKNWKTTACGISIIVGAIAAVVMAYTDSDPSTVPDIPIVITTIIAAAGLILARDGKDGGAGK